MFFALYADLKRFVGLCNQLSRQLSSQETHAELDNLASQIFRDYIIDGNTFGLPADPGSPVA